ncbi:MAG: helix-turn-helix domain-containing protein [Oenococcus sp.]|uniref:TetR/AcrR family transcriptional regulator n=1 Tax=Oenococcus sp. TaxID=1979414 RepID=UPI0039E886AD
MLPGRPRDSDIESRTIKATQELLIDYIPENITIDAIAKRAKIAKTTIYRRYDSKKDIVLAALIHMKSLDLSNLPFIDLNETIDIIADRFLEQYNNKTARAMLSVLFRTLNVDDEIAQLYFQNHELLQIKAFAQVISHFDIKTDALALSDLLLHYAMGVFLMESISQTPAVLKKGLHRLIALYH